MPIGIHLLQHTVYRYRGPVWVDDIDLVWIIIAAPFGSYRSRTVIVASGTYSFSPVSTSKVFASMNIKENEKYTQRKCIKYMI